MDIPQIYMFVDAIKANEFLHRNYMHLTIDKIKFSGGNGSDRFIAIIGMVRPGMIAMVWESYCKINGLKQ